MGNEEENDDDDEKEEEQEKIEKFFALIRSTKEMRDHLRNRPNGSKEEEEGEEKKKQVAAAWNPTFQPEDFIEDSKFKKPSVANDAPAAGPSSKTQHEQEKEAKEGEEDCSLDLKLSL
ncbi:hypothetical protein DITRI_Ditri20bG0003100 [Diplodiscus trichospermus]